MLSGCVVGEVCGAEFVVECVGSYGCAYVRDVRYDEVSESSGCGALVGDLSGCVSEVSDGGADGWAVAGAES